MLDEHIKQAGFGVNAYLDILGYHVSSYTTFVIAAFVSAFILYRAIRKPLEGQQSDYRYFIILAAFTGGILGSKLPIFLANYQYWFQYPQNIQLLMSGRTIVGGLIGGFLAVLLVKRVFHIRMRAGNDLAAPVALGMAVGRMGCFFGGCCYGIPAVNPSLGVNFGDGVLRYPTQLYELVFDLVLCGVLLYIGKKKDPEPGVLFFYLLNSYLIFRFFLEFIRAGSTVFLGLTFYQIICIACIVIVNLKYLKGKGIENAAIRHE